MNQIEKVLLSVCSQYREIIEVIRDHSVTYPKGSLRVKKTGKTYQYFWYDGSNEKKERYLSQKQSPKIRDLAVKEYERNLQKALSEQLQLISDFLRFYRPDALKEVFDALHPAKKAFVVPFELERRQEETQTHRRSSAQDYPTQRGDYVRSTSVAMIADMLYENEIPYRIDYEVSPDGQSTINADFEIINTDTQKSLFLMHFDKMDDVHHLIQAQSLKTYLEKHGLLENRDFIISTENERNPVGESLSVIKAKVKGILGEK